MTTSQKRKKTFILDHLPELIEKKYPGKRKKIAAIALSLGIEVKDSWGKQRIYQEMSTCPSVLLELLESVSLPASKPTMSVISPRTSCNIRAQHNSEHIAVQFAKTIAHERLMNAKRFILRAIREGNLEENKPLLIEFNAILQSFKIANTVSSIRGVEGSGYRLYRSALHRMSKYSFKYGGMKTPSPFVAMLQFVEQTLLSLSIEICWEAGLDPYVGLYHNSKSWGFAGLAYDLIHPYTPKLIDAVVMSTINKQQIALKDFDDWRGSLSTPVQSILKTQLQKTLNRMIIYRLDWIDEQDQITYEQALKRQADCFANFILGRCDFQPFIIK